MKMMSRGSVILAILLLVIANISSVMAKPDEEQQVTLVEVSDFQCPFCARFTQETLPQIRAAYGDRVKIIFKHFPLSFHENAQNAAEASECARDQGKFWEYHDLLFSNQQALDGESLKKYAAALDLDEEKFNDCVDSHRKKETVLNDFNEGVAHGVEGTPTIFVVGDNNADGDYEKIVGAQPFSVYQAAIDKVLKRAGQLPPTATTAYMPTPADTSIVCDMTGVITEGETIEDPHKVVLAKADVATATATLVVDGETYALSAYEQKPRNGVKLFGVGQIEGKNAVKYGVDCKQTTPSAIPQPKQAPFPSTPPTLPTPTWPTPSCPVNILMENEYGVYETKNGKFEVTATAIEPSTGGVSFVINGEHRKAMEYSTITLDNGEHVYVYNIGMVNDVDAIKFGVDCRNEVPHTPPVDNTICCDIPRVPGDVSQGVEHILMPATKCQHVNGMPTLEFNCKNTADPIVLPTIEIAVPPEPSTIQYGLSEEDKYKYLEEKRRQAEQVFGCANGCGTDHSCLAYGIRMLDQQTKKPVYCDIDGGFKPQQADDSSCQNNYECLSNTCSNGACINLQRELQQTQSLLKKVLSWLGSVFG